LKNRVFIDGASIAGLTAAARLAKSKYQVTVSGDTYKNTKIDDYTFDSGSLFHCPRFIVISSKRLGSTLAKY
jgi:2-polyprenyl-6-methoxyphenol hydroxylase-like FAD-dependent oxidoreductase